MSDNSTPNILIVDDFVHMQNLMKALIKNYNVNVDIASNGEDAVNYAKDKMYKFILMDLQMPILDGIDAAKKIKNDINQNQVIYAVSANDDTLSTSSNGERSLYFDDFFSKAGMASKIFQLLDKHNITSIH